MSLESTGSRCEQLARQIQVHGRVIPIEETKAKIAAVTIEQVQEAARAAFRAPPTLAALGPAGKVPGLAEIAEQAGGLSRARVSEPRTCHTRQARASIPFGARSGHLPHGE